MLRLTLRVLDSEVPLPCIQTVPSTGPTLNEDETSFFVLTVGAWTLVTYWEVPKSIFFAVGPVVSRVAAQASPHSDPLDQKQ